MTLRSRLLLVLVGVVAAGLVISDVVVYAQLQSFLVSRVDAQLNAASYTVTRVLVREHVIPFGAGGTGTATRTGAASEAGGTSTTTTPPPTFPTGSFPFTNTHPGSSSRGGLFPEGTIGELIGPGGHVKGAPVSFVYGGTAPPAPVLPHPLPIQGRSSVVFSTGSAGKNAVAYRVLAKPLNYRGLTVVVAIPLTEVNGTLHRLGLVMVLVSAGVLIGLGVLAWWIVRRGLRPLEEMAVTAGAIAGGDLGRRVAPAEDRTEVGRLGLALNAMLGEIEEAFSARAASEGRLRRFLADASHELRTPLTSIRGYAEIFDMGARDRPEDLATAMHHIREEADRMKVLVDDLLLLARLDRERPLEVVPTDLVMVVARSVRAARAAAPDRSVSLEAPPVAMVLGDAHRLRQVVDNLLMNAVRHSPEGAPIAVRMSVDGAMATVEVVDHGPGVPADDTERIFEPFYRADTSRTRTTGGAGLGLAIVAAIARAHGGTVGVKPNSGDGAHFWVRIPRAPDAPAALSPRDSDSTER